MTFLKQNDPKKRKCKAGRIAYINPTRLPSNSTLNNQTSFGPRPYNLAPPSSSFALSFLNPTRARPRPRALTVPAAINPPHRELLPYPISPQQSRSRKNHPRHQTLLHHLALQTANTTCALCAPAAYSPSLPGNRLCPGRKLADLEANEALEWPRDEDFK